MNEQHLKNNLKNKPHIQLRKIYNLYNISSKMKKIEWFIFKKV